MEFLIVSRHVQTSLFISSFIRSFQFTDCWVRTPFLYSYNHSKYTSKALDEYIKNYRNRLLLRTDIVDGVVTLRIHIPLIASAARTEKLTKQSNKISQTISPTSGPYYILQSRGLNVPDIAKGEYVLSVSMSICVYQQIGIRSIFDVENVRGLEVKAYFSTT